jgi:GAF domain-containing protein
VVAVQLSPPLRDGTFIAETLVRNVLPRGLFFLFILFLAFARGNRLREQAEELEALHITAIKIANNEDLHSRLEAIMDVATGLLGAKGCKVFLRVVDQKRLELVAVKGVKSDVLKPGYVLPVGTGLAGEVISRKSPMITNDYPNCQYRVPELANLFGAVIEVPLLFKGEAIGVLAVFDDAQPSRFTEQDIPILVRLAQHAAIAIHDIDLVEQVQRQKEALQALNIAGDAMTANLDVNNTLNSVVKHAWELSLVYNEDPPLFACVSLLDEKAQYLQFEAAYPEEQLGELRSKVGRIDLSRRPSGVVGEAIRTQSSQRVPDVTRSQDYIDFYPDTRSQLAVLIRRGTDVLGVLSIEHADYDAFSEELQENLEVLADQAGAAIQNAYLFDQIEAQRRQAEKLHRASIVMSSARGLTNVAKSILKELHNLVPYDRATLQLVKGDERELIAKINLEDDRVLSRLLRPISRDDLILEIVKRKEICVLSPPDEHPSWESLPTTFDIKSWIGIPLVFGDDVIALITVDHLQQGLYSEDHKSLLELFTNHASSVLQNAILLQQNSERLEELAQTKDSLETVLDYLENQSNLALIGLVYGESIHYAKNQLGMAKSRADNIARGYYDQDPNELRKSAAKIIEYINSYLGVLDETQREALQSPSPKLVDVHRLLDQVIRSKRISRAITISREYRATDSLVHAPESQLRQVFYVIVQNALDAMKSGQGVLGIRTQLSEETGRTFVKVSISDTGRGIPKKEQRDLFRVRLQDGVRQRRRGSGMGLVWALSFLRSYGGDIKFETSRGKGTTMHIFLPKDFDTLWSSSQD